MSLTTFHNEANIELDIRWDGPHDVVTMRKHGLSVPVTPSFEDVIDDEHSSITTVTLTVYRPTLTGSYHGYAIGSWWIEGEDQQRPFTNTFPPEEPDDPSYRTQPYPVPEVATTTWNNSWTLCVDLEPPSSVAESSKGPSPVRLKLVFHDPIFKIKRQSGTRRVAT